MTPRSLRIIGPGRAGGALSLALARAGWTISEPVRHGQPAGSATADVDLLVIATPDAAIADVADSVDPDPTTVVAHLAGSLGLDVLARHRRVAAIHPLVSLPTAEIGAERLLAGAWFAMAGDPLAEEVVDDLHGRTFAVSDADRATYHAAACIASNHLVALLGQVERAATSVDVPFEAYVELARDTIENVARLGPAGALTGPVARDDWTTVARHLAALEPSERRAYEAMADQARRLVRRPRS